MLLISLIFLIIAIATPVQVIGISSSHFIRLTSIIFLFSGALSYNVLYIQSIGSGLGLYSGLYQVSILTQVFDIFIFIIAALVIMP